MATWQSLQTLLLIVFFSTIALFFFLLSDETRLVALTFLQEEEEDKASCIPNSKEVAGQVISMEEDGRLGNLLIETATLLLIGKQANVTVSLLPQVSHIQIFSCPGSSIYLHLGTLEFETIQDTSFPRWS